MSRLLTKTEMIALKVKNGVSESKYVTNDSRPLSVNDDGYRQFLIEQGKKRAAKKLRRKKFKSRKAQTKLANKQKLNKRLIQMSESLKKNTPKSELWFYNHYEAFTVATDVFNTPFKCYIPDIMNRKYRYIIEIDGSIHQVPEQRKKDIRKDLFYTRHGFVVIRVIAYDTMSLKVAIDAVIDRRKEFDKVLRKER